MDSGAAGFSNDKVRPGGLYNEALTSEVWSKEPPGGFGALNPKPETLECLPAGLGLQGFGIRKA